MMKNNFARKVAIPMLFLLAMISGAKAQFSMDGELRTRAEVRNGFKQLRNDTSKVAAFISQRSRLTLNYKNSSMTTKLSFQDVRIWGDEIIKQDVPSTAVHEAWAEVKLLDSLSIKIGRQELSYDNQRLIGRGNWSQAGTSHDAAVLKFHYNGLTLDLGSAFNQTYEATYNTYYGNLANNYKNLNFLWLTKKIDAFSVSGVGILDGYQRIKDLTVYRYTCGGVLDYQGDIAATARGFYQGGEQSDGKKVSAYFANAEVSYKIGATKILIGAEYLSGTENTNTTDSHTFNTLYGTSHALNGNMEYFTKSAGTKNAGLIDAYFNLSEKVSDKISVRADYHYFMLPTDYYDSKAKANIDSYLASEIDLSAKFEFSKEVNLELGYSFLKGTPALATLQSSTAGKSGTPCHWAFFMLTIKPTFFKN